MSKETIFFSYSRDDSEFVLNLAKNLRDSGADIWLDQLDIQPGTRWDKSIQTALEESKTIIVVLSKSAVESNNVMDEVSFALEENKKVVPVLLEECDIPFRLKRLQFANFSDNPKKGMDTLVKSLNIKQVVAEKLSNSIDVIESKESDNITEKKIIKPSSERKNSENTNLKKNTKKLPKIVYVAIAIVLGVVLISQLSQTDIEDEPIVTDNDDESNWASVEISGALDDYKFHVASFPNCIHKDAAMEFINEGNAWETSILSNSIEGYQKYIYDYPNGKYVSEANKYMLDITVDDVAFESASQINTVTSYLDYLLNTSVLGNHSEDAFNALGEIADSGWLYYGRHNGTEMVESIFDVLSSAQSDEVVNNQIPKQNDIVQAKAARYTYNSSNDQSNSNRTGSTIQINKKAIILNVENAPNGAIFVEIMY
jgi:hypothetical protein